MAKPPKGKRVTIHLLMMSDGARSWMAIGSRRDELVKLLLATKGTSPGPHTLSKRRDFDMLRSGKHRSASVSNLNTLLDVFRPFIDIAASLAPGGAQIGQQVTSLIERMPNKGRSAIFAHSDTKGGRAPVFSSTLQVPRGTLEDVGWLVQGAIKLFQGGMMP